MKRNSQIFSIIMAIVVTSAIGFNYRTTSATHSSFDLANLRETLPDFTLAYDKIRVQSAWEFIKSITPQLVEVIVGVVDDGLDRNHPEFTGVNLGRTPIGIDRESHGTAVAGIIGANNLSAISSANYRFPQVNGILSGVTSNYVLGVRDVGEGRVDNFETALKDLLAGQADLINISLGFVLEDALTEEQKILFAGKALNQERFDEYSRFFDDYFSKNPDAMFIVSAGNQNIDVINHAPGGQANKPNTIAAGATNLSDGRAIFRPNLAASNFGSGVAISAPGEGIYAPSRFEAPLDLNDYWNPQNTTPTSTDPINVQRFFGGTSGAAPFVTGVAAILKSIKPELTPAQIKNILIQSADPISTDKPIGPRLNALKAAQSLLGPPPTPTTILRFFPLPRFNTAGYFGVGWEKNTDTNFASYKIFRSTSPSVTTNDTLVATLTNQNQVFFRDENLAPATYFYKVFVFNQSGAFSPSNEVSGRIFGGSEVITRIPGVPEPGDTNFPLNVAVPDQVFTLFEFDCPRSIFDFFTCTGPFTIIGNRLDEFGHSSKLRAFNTNVVNNKFNNIDNFQFIVHSRDEFRISVRAVDDSYTVFQPDFGLVLSVPSSGLGTTQVGMPVDFGGRFFSLFIRNSIGATNNAGTLNIAF